MLLSLWKWHSLTERAGFAVCVFIRTVLWYSSAMHMIVNRLTSTIKMLIYTHIGKIDRQTVFEKNGNLDICLRRNVLECMMYTFWKDVSYNTEY